MNFAKMGEKVRGNALSTSLDKDLEFPEQLVPLVACLNELKHAVLEP